MKVSNVDVRGLAQSIVAASYPFRVNTPVGEDFNEEVSLIEYTTVYGLEGVDPELRGEVERRINRAKSLAQTPKGSAHDQFLTGINVSFDLTCTNKMWVEMERYRFVYFVSSQSTIHKISEFDLSKSYNEYVDPRIIKIMEELKNKYNETQDMEDYYKLLYSNPAGFELTARLTTNYRSLKTIYSQRRNHILNEWKEFCKWVETLPMAEELILGRD